METVTCEQWLVADAAFREEVVADAGLGDHRVLAGLDGVYVVSRVGEVYAAGDDGSVARGTAEFLDRACAEGDPDRNLSTVRRMLLGAETPTLWCRDYIDLPEGSKSGAVVLWTELLGLQADQAADLDAVCAAFPDRQVEEAIDELDSLLAEADNVRFSANFTVDGYDYRLEITDAQVMGTSSTLEAELGEAEITMSLTTTATITNLTTGHNAPLPGLVLGAMWPAGSPACEHNAVGYGTVTTGGLYTDTGNLDAYCNGYETFVSLHALPGAVADIGPGERIELRTADLGWGSGVKTYPVPEAMAGQVVGALSAPTLWYLAVGGAPPGACTFFGPLASYEANYVTATQGISC